MDSISSKTQNLEILISLNSPKGDGLGRGAGYSQEGGGWVDGWVCGRAGGWVDGWMSGWVGGREGFRVYGVCWLVFSDNLN